MTQIPAGWYPDPAPGPPGMPQGQRYWDGTQWTGHVHSPSAYGQMPVYGGQPGAPYPPVKTTPDGQELARWLPRLGAYLIDAVVVGVVATVLGLPLLISYIREYMAYVDDVVSQPAEPSAFSSLGAMTVGFGELIGLTAISFLVAVCYHGGFLRWKGATPGKMALGLQVRLREAPGQLPWSAIALRLLVQHGASLFAVVPLASLVVSWFPLLDGLWPLWDQKNQALHDKAARTNVVVQRRSA